MTKYPVYIVSKGRADRPLTARAFLRDSVPFKIVVEPQEYKEYCDAVGEENVLELPFSNLGKGSYPARNFCWEDSLKNGHDKHWVFDDNIYGFRRLNRGKRIPVESSTALKVLEDFTGRYSNIGITAFNYLMFVPNINKKPFSINAHTYSALLINNHMPYRWRLKYNEDIDLCLQVLHNGLCTVLFHAFMADKVSTTVKMKGGNQADLYKNNDERKKILKARVLEEIWPQYAKTIMLYGRPHHRVDLLGNFKHGLILKGDEQTKGMKKVNNFGMELKAKKPIQSESLKDYIKNKTK